MSGYLPGAGDHAIDQAVVGVRLLKAADESNFQRAVDLATKLAVELDLPGRLQLDPLSMVFGRQVISPGYAMSGELSPGLVFQRVNRDGSMDAELTLERNAVTFRTRSYRRWCNVVDLLSGILGPVAEQLTGNSIDALSVIELRCIDQFVSKSNNEPLNSLVRNGSPYVCTSLLNRQDMVHNHIGWFENVTSEGRTLINLNVEIGENLEHDRMATVLQVVSLQSTGNNSRFASQGTFSEVMIKHFNYLHKYDKYIMSNLLTDELQKQINLSGDSGISPP